MNIHRRSLCAMASLAAAVCVPSALYAQRFQGEIQQMLAPRQDEPTAAGRHPLYRQQHLPILDASERADGAAAGVQPRFWRLGDPGYS
jgi:hypothetical protein